MPRFSVIIPTYNRAPLLREALDSVFLQAFADYEVIVVDDGSKDNTPELVTSYGARVRYLRQANRGPGAARNLGAKHATGEYLAFLDSDDRWFPWTLTTYHKILSNHRVSLLLGCPFGFHQASDLVCQESETKLFLTEDYAAGCLRPCVTSSAYTVVNASAFRAVGGFHESIIVYEDMDLGLRLCKSPGFVCVDAPSTVALRVTPNSLTSNLGASAEGILEIAGRERRGQYPGGKSCALIRIGYIGLTQRSLCFGLLRAGRYGEASRVYLTWLVQNLRLLRFKFLFGAPVYAVWSICKSPLARRAQTQQTRSG